MANCSGRFRLPKKAYNPLNMGYGSELDMSPEIGPDAASFFQTFIGALRWMIELKK